MSTIIPHYIAFVSDLKILFLYIKDTCSNSETGTVPKRTGFETGIL